MILWGRPSSVNVQKVLWALDELGLDFDHRIVGGPHGGLDSAEFRAVSPLPRVPVLVEEDGAAIWESHAILRHLARREGRLGAPETPVDMWMEFGSTTLQPPFIGVFWQLVRTLPQDRSAELLARHTAAMVSALEVLDGALEGQSHVAGDDFSIADIALGCMMYRITDLAPAALETVPNVASWGARLASRPAYQKWIETSYDELKVTE